MGQYLTSEKLRTRFARPLVSLGRDFSRLSDRWKKACETGQISRPDLLLNDAMPSKALAVLRRLHDEASGKLDAAVAGAYRYRDSERRATRPRRAT